MSKSKKINAAAFNYAKKAIKQPASKDAMRAVKEDFTAGAEWVIDNLVQLGLVSQPETNPAPQKSAYLMEINGVQTVVMALNIADAMDKAQQTSKTGEYRMIFNSSLNVL